MGMVGGWKYQRMEPCCLPRTVAYAFREAFANFVGVRYVPVLYVASQVVNGINYCLICQSFSATNPPTVGCKRVIINKPADGSKATIVDIVDIL